MVQNNINNIDIQKIKIYLFDFGNVLYKVEPQKCLSAFARLNPDILDRNISEFTPIVMEYESGKLTNPQFRAKFSEFININVSEEVFDNAWNQILIEPLPDAVDIVRKFKMRGRIMLLSNTNEIHRTRFEPECCELFGLFEKLFFSYQIGLYKPDPEIYRYVIKEIGCHPDEILFFDDSKANIESAAALGIQIYQINENQKLSDLL
ncbi:MAG: glucose-phosphatase [Bacteroidota bacterium]|nr:glucose-phosphatase [Bacteroidota bacterium]